MNPTRKWLPGRTPSNETTHDNNLVGLHGGLVRDMWEPQISY
jgi:hypothetical protein